MRQRIVCLLTLACLHTAGFAETVGLFYDSSVPQASFAAGELQGDLQKKNCTVELKPLAEFSADYPHKRIVLTLAAAEPTTEMFRALGGDPVVGLDEQAFALRSTSKGQRTHWVFGGDINGLMYGGLQLAETIRFQGLIGSYNMQESPHIKNRGVKYNLPLDARVPTYVGYGDKSLAQAFGGDAAKEAIPAAWDMDYWKDWFDEMARARFNVLAIWNSHPFPALLDMEEAVEDVQGFNGYSKKMSPAEKVAFWQKVMAYGKGRGFQIYFITWNIYTYGAEGKNGINNDPKNEATKKYFRKATRLMFETYPDLDGLGVTAGENMNRLSPDAEGQWMWEGYGQGMLDYAKTHPERNITFIHRWHYANITQVMSHFEPLLALPNVRLDMSYKYSAAHMYSTVTPKLIYTKHGDVPADLDNTKKKTWLEVRQDDFYFLHWGHPQFARAYIQNFPDKDRYIQGFFYGGDGWTATRDFYSKTEIHKNVLDINRLWYTQMIWGRLAYNPHTPDQVFIDEIAYRYPQVSATDLFDAWSHASRGLPLAAEVIQGTLCFDFHWWPELCQGGKGFLTIDDFIKAKPSIGSQLCSIEDSAAGNCQAGLSSYDVANTVQRAGEVALEKLAEISANGHADLEVNLKHIYAQAYLSLYYAEKMRAATCKAAGRPGDVTIALGQAKHHWKKYVDIMDGLFIGAKMLRTRDFEDWHVHDAAVGKEYTDAAGIETPEQYAQRMAWYKDAKFGMFIHWGVYSQAGGEWNGETDHAEWLQLTAKIPLAEYTEYAKTFNPVQFDADEWVQILKDAGMKYLVITSKHHDGFAMYDSACNPHNIVQGSAFKRDPLKELADACAKQGIRFCVYYSLGRDWQDPEVPTGTGEKAGWRSNLVDFPDEDAKDFSKYFERKAKPQVRELMTQLGPIGVMWFDTYGLIQPEQSQELIDMIRSLQPSCIINSRVGRGLGDYSVSEQKIPSKASDRPWESCMTMNGKWSYNRADNNWKSTETLLHNLIDIVSKGGNYLLNVGPSGEGIIPPPSVTRLAEMGQWLRVNGEAIYGCGPTPFGVEIQSKLPWRATTQSGKTFVHLFEWPAGKMTLPVVDTPITRVTLLADPKGTELAFSQTDQGVSISLPAQALDPVATVICLELASN